MDELPWSAALPSGAFHSWFLFAHNTANASGDGTFPAQQTFPAGNGTVSVATGDFNGDSRTDLATANCVSDDVSVLLGNGDGTFQAAQNFAVGINPDSVTTGDFNGDGVTVARQQFSSKTDQFIWTIGQ